MSADPRECPKRCNTSLPLGAVLGTIRCDCQFLDGHAGMHRGIRFGEAFWWGSAQEHDEETTPAGVFEVPSGVVTSELVEILRSEIRARGGNVQVVFGDAR